MKKRKLIAFIVKKYVSSASAKNAAVKAKNGYKCASLPCVRKKRIFEMQQIEQRDKIAKACENVIFRCRTDPLQCQITAVRSLRKQDNEHHYRKNPTPDCENPILLYMKGSPKLPSCGFSPRQSRRLPHVANVLPMLIFSESGHSCGTAEIC